MLRYRRSKKQYKCSSWLLLPYWFWQQYSLLGFIFFKKPTKDKNICAKYWKHRINKFWHTHSLQLEEKNTALAESKEKIQLLNENLEQKVRDRTHTLEIANEKLRNYSFLNSHAVRRPLANILGLVNILDLENPESQENKTYLEMLGQSAQELDAVIHDINQQLGNSEKPI